MANDRLPHSSSVSLVLPASKAKVVLVAGRRGFGFRYQFLPEVSGWGLVARIARPTSLAIWHRGRSHRRPNRSGSPNRRHFASLDL